MLRKVGKTYILTEKDFERVTVLTNNFVINKKITMKSSRNRVTGSSRQ